MGGYLEQMRRIIDDLNNARKYFTVGDQFFSCLLYTSIVAKRGALFMIDLKNEVLKRGFKVAHIKTTTV